MNFEKLLLCMSVAGMVASCTSDIDLCDVGAANEQEKSEITINVAPFVFDNDAKTRASFNEIENGEELSLEFTKDDEFGICSECGYCSAYVKFKEYKKGIKGEVNGDLESGDYRFFYPRSAYYRDGGIYMDFSNQVQDGCKADNMVSNNNYLVSTDVLTYGGRLSKFTLVPLNAVFKITAYLPRGNYSKIELVNVEGKKTFYSSAFVNKLCSYNEDDDDYEEPEIILGDPQSSLSMELKNYHVNVGGKYNLYMSVCPSDMGEFKVKLIREDGESYISAETFNLGNVEQGYGYVLKCTFPTFVDLGLPNGTKWATTNVGAVDITEGGNFYTWSEGVAVAESYGEGWHLPSYDEMCELIDNCYMEKCVDYNGTGIKGDIFYKPIKPADRGAKSFPGSSFKKRDGYTLDQPHIFFPYAGMYDEDGDFWGRTCFAVWTSDKSGKNASIFGGMYNSGSVGLSMDIPVNFRVQVRPVYSK